jgi:hypothetical protein
VTQALAPGGTPHSPAGARWPDRSAVL